MLSILYWIVWTFLECFATWFWKKAILSWKYNKVIFQLFSSVGWLFFIFFVFYLFWIEKNIFNNFFDIFLIFIISFLWILNTFLQIKVYKETKLSQLLPYDNLDKLFVIIIWYFLFYWTSNWTSIITLFVSIFTLFIILILSVDIKNIKIPKNIWLFWIYKWINALNNLITGYLLIKYSNITYVIISWFSELIIYILIAILLKYSFKIMLEQNKVFYKNRFLAVVLWRISWIISLFIIKESWIIVATLLWFLAIIWNVISMKFLLKDNPTKKQTILAITVIFLIWIWYYFK